MSTDVPAAAPAGKIRVMDGTAARLVAGTSIVRASRAVPRICEYFIGSGSFSSGNVRRDRRGECRGPQVPTESIGKDKLGRVQHRPHHIFNTASTLVAELSQPLLGLGTLLVGRQPRVDAQI